jgi:hypothetical protein
MDIFLGMNTPSTGPNDFPGLYLRLAHFWPMIVILIVCFYEILAVWVVKKVREATAIRGDGPGAGNPSDGPTNVAGPSGPIGTDEKATEPGRDASPLDPRFYRCFELTS